MALVLCCDPERSGQDCAQTGSWRKRTDRYTETHSYTGDGGAALKDGQDELRHDGKSILVLEAGQPRGLTGAEGSGDGGGGRYYARYEHRDQAGDGCAGSTLDERVAISG